MSAQEKHSKVPAAILCFVLGLSVGLVILAAKCPPVPAPAGQPAPIPAKPVAGEPAMHTPAPAAAPAPMADPQQQVAAPSIPGKAEPVAGGQDQAKP